MRSAVPPSARRSLICPVILRPQAAIPGGMSMRAVPPLFAVPPLLAVPPLFAGPPLFAVPRFAVIAVACIAVDVVTGSRGVVSRPPLVAAPTRLAAVSRLLRVAAPVPVVAASGDQAAHLRRTSPFLTVPSCTRTVISSCSDGERTEGRTHHNSKNRKFLLPAYAY